MGNSLRSSENDFKLLPIGPRTEEAYYACVRQLGEFYSKSPELLCAEDIRQYFIHLKTHKKVARQTSTQAICAIKLFLKKTLQHVWPRELELARANHQFKLPVVFSASEVRRVLAAVGTLDRGVLGMEKAFRQDWSSRVEAR